MNYSFNPPSAGREPRILWVDLTREAGTALVDAIDGAFDVYRVRKLPQVPDAIQIYSPLILCFEFDTPDSAGIEALTRTRRVHPSLPTLMITGCHSEAVAICALRLRVWDLLVKPVSIEALNHQIAALTIVTRQRGSESASEILFPSQGTEDLSALDGHKQQARTFPAIALVAAQFDRKIALEYAAALCRLSASQFCRIFKQEYGVSFGQYLLRYRIDRACERLANSGALAKEVAYSVGFNDHSYFTRAFKRQVGLCPSEYRGAQDSPND
ncbi:helix-turn-helix domain-containing protein [Cupriavidus oxalaticus]|nr:DNA-binding response regulator [Cupriavidus oxalaticus]